MTLTAMTFAPLPHVLRNRLLLALVLAIPLGNWACGGPPDAPPSDDRITVLFLGDDGHHRPWERARSALPHLTERGIDLFYTEDPEDLNRENLSRYHVVMMYGNQPHISGERLKDLLDWVEDGGGLVALHSASASFPNSEEFIRLVGGAFRDHGLGTFSTVTLEASHPALRGVPDFESYDETYVHQKHNPDRTVLAVRRHEGGDEPYTWVRNQGSGRVFYSAWGHDLRTWTNPGFLALLEQGTRWVAGDWALDAQPPALAEPDRTALERPLPFYPEGEPWSTTGPPITEAQNPVSPEESPDYMVLPPGFRVELFAAEPQLVNPIDIAWDERGRAWVIETVDYPNNLVESGAGNDRILILEDTDSDGRADDVSVFAEGLNIPTSLTLVRDGAIVAQAPHMLLLRDTNGDGQADSREILFTGWQTFDTHAGPSNLRYGLDNQIWGAVGYSGFEGSVGGQAFDFAQGFYRFTPDATSLEYLGRTSNNTWGLGMSEEGYVFGSTANREPNVYLAVPRRFYESVEGWETSILPSAGDRAEIFPLRDDIRQVDQHGRYTAGAGHELYTARDFPREYWNRVAFVAEPTGHLLGQFVLEPDGSNFLLRNRWNLLASRDGWTAPIQSRVGPDGALWVLDWYNLVIQHNPTPSEDGFERGPGNAYETPNRDRNHGRIYRIVYEGPDSDPRPASSLDLADAPVQELVDALSHDNLFWRTTAQRLLVEGGHTEARDALVAMAARQELDDTGQAPGSLHALWTLDGLGLTSSDTAARDAVVAALNHPAAAVRRGAVMILPRDGSLASTLVDAGIIPGRHPLPTDEYHYMVPPHLRMDAHPQVRLAAVLALAESPPSETAGRAAADLLLVPANALDRWIPDALIAAGARHHAFFLPAVEAARGQIQDEEVQEAVARVLEVVSRHAAAAGTP
ncbi:MAG: PVC-type heme-binding CxxCH protein [Gemmatimonadota bacterium]